MKPFDLKLAKTPSNPNGLEVCTSDNENVEIIDVIKSSIPNQKILFPIVAIVNGITYCFMEDGNFGTEDSKLNLKLR